MQTAHTKNDLIYIVVKTVYFIYNFNSNLLKTLSKQILKGDEEYITALSNSFIGFLTDAINCLTVSMNTEVF